jgi:copper transport protein
MRAWRRTRRIWRSVRSAATLVLATGLLTAGAVALGGTPAQAHATLVETTPPNGAQLDAPPPEIRLRFTERVTVALDGVRLLRVDGAEVDTEPASVAADDPTTVVLPVPADLPDGGYVVSFRVVSADSHPIGGALTFGIGVAATPLDQVELPEEDRAVTTVFAVARWVSYAGLALLGGAVAVFVLCWPAGWTNRRARRTVAIGWAASLVGSAAVLLLQGPYSAGRPLSEVADPALLSATLDTDYGRYVLARAALVAAAGLLLVPAGWWSRRPAAWRAAGAVTVAVALPVTWVGTGHTNTSDNPLDLAADVAHLIAMASWFGGLGLLAVCVLPRSAGLPAEQVGTTLRRFSLLATAAVATLVVTGVYVAWRRVGTLDALLGTPYGRLLAFKLAAMGVLLWLGAMSRSVVQRRYADPTVVADPTGAVDSGAGRSKRRAARSATEQEQRARSQLRQSVRLEVVAAVGVLAVASVLVATPPGVVTTVAEATENTAATGEVTGPVLQDVILDDERMMVQVLVDPAWAGENRLGLSVTDLGFRPVDVPEVRASFSLPEQALGPLPVELTRTGPGEYESVGVQLPVAGAWRLDVTVRTTEIDSTTVQVDVPVT